MVDGSVVDSASLRGEGVIADESALLGSGGAGEREVHQYAKRYEGSKVFIERVRSWPPEPEPGVALVVFAEAPDAAADGIADEIRPTDVMITADIPLTAHCLEGGAAALAPNGHEFTQDSICNALATREIKAYAREPGIGSGGPPPMTARDRSRFSNELDRVARPGNAGESELG